MLDLFQKFVFTMTFNSALFLLLIIGIQNSEHRSSVKLIIGETISLPISFIVGMSFISGSISGSFLTFTLNNNK